MAAAAARLVAAETTPRALILYDGTSQKAPEGMIDGLHVANLMGHFGFKAVLQPIEEYRDGGMAPYEAVFVAGGSDKTRWPASVLRDARARSARLVWLGYGLDSFLPRPEARKRGLRVDSVRLNSPMPPDSVPGPRAGQGRRHDDDAHGRRSCAGRGGGGDVHPGGPQGTVHPPQRQPLAGGGCAVRLHRGAGSLSGLLRPAARHPRRGPSDARGER